MTIIKKQSNLYCWTSIPNEIWFIESINIFLLKIFLVILYISSFKYLIVYSDNVSLYNYILVYL